MSPDPDRPHLSAFAGLRVVEMGVWVAAPSAAALLGDWGADVIKVEAPSGDPMRQVFGSLGIESDMPNPAFALDNRGKRSVVLNLREEVDRHHLEDLLATADVFISNLRPDSLDGLGLEPDATVARHPPTWCTAASADTASAATSVTVPPTTSGPSGPGPVCPCRWPTPTATPSMPGAASATTSPDWPPWPACSPRSMEQRQTGRGRVVEVSLLRTGAYVLGWDLGLQMTLGKVARADRGSGTRRR